MFGGLPGKQAKKHIDERIPPLPDLLTQIRLFFPYFFHIVIVAGNSGGGVAIQSRPALK